MKYSGKSILLGATLVLAVTAHGNAVGGNNPGAEPAAAQLYADNIDKCTERYNYCISSCESQRQQCMNRGNDSSYCDAAYTSCSTGCENHMHGCWEK